MRRSGEERDGVTQIGARWAGKREMERKNRGEVVGEERDEVKNRGAVVGEDNVGEVRHAVTNS